MRLFCFQDFSPEKRPSNRLFKQQEEGRQLADLGGVDRVTRFYMREGGNDTLERENPVEAANKRMQERRQETRRALDETQRPVTDEAKERLRERTVSEIFGDRETQDYYINVVQSAFKSLSPDKLHAFIKSHATYGKSGFKAWNTELYRLLGVRPKEKYKGKEPAQTKKRICAALQHVLVDFYETDVFQLTRKTINPWIFIDGRLGPYSVSVMAAYWNTKYGKTAKKRLRPNPLPDSGLSPKSYRPDGPADQSYKSAMRILDGQLGKSKTESPATRPVGEPSAVLAEKVRSRYRKLDKEGGKITMDQLVLPVISTDYTEPVNLSMALALAYGEQPRPKNTKESPKLFRILHLVAEKIGPEINNIRITSGDSIEVTAGGRLIIKNGNTEKYNINLNT